MKKIVEITENAIVFDNGSNITFDHRQDCYCYEYNYADFQQLDDVARTYEFDTNLVFEAVEGSGFRFGDVKAMFFVPCYSDQNGYYSNDIDIYYNGLKVLSFWAEMREY